MIVSAPVHRPVCTHSAHTALLALLILVPGGGAAQAKTVYVNGNATGTIHDGTSWPKAALTLKAGLAATANGDEVWVARGIYAETVTASTAVSLYGGFVGTEANRTDRNPKVNVTTLDGGGGSSPVLACSGTQTTIDGFDIRNSRIGVSVNAGTSTVANCTVSRMSLNGIVLNSGGMATITGCALSSNVTAVNATCGPATLRSCTFSGNVTGIDMTVSGRIRLTLANCTITGNTTGLNVPLNNTAVISNCIFAFNQTSAALSQTSTVSFSDAYGNSTGNFAGGPDPTGPSFNFSADPLLSNPYHDVHLQPGSPCIDAGDDSVVQAGWTDVDGQPRIIGSHVDIGSDESDGTSWTVPSKTWYVYQSGRDTNDGSSWNAAKKTIGNALSVAQGGDEVWVANGVYQESVTIPAGVAVFGGFTGTETTRVQRDWKANATALDGSLHPTSNIVTSSSIGVVLDGFSIRNGATGFASASGAATIANCGFARNGYGVSLYSGAVSGCTFTANFTYGIVLNGPTIVSNCTISGSAWGLYTYIWGASLASITNCTVSGNEVGISATNGAISLANNIVALNQTGVQMAAASTLSHNDVFGNTTANYTGVADPTGTNGNINADPLLSNPYHDIHLQPGSPCIDAGDNTAVLAGWTDVDGQPRIIGAHVDIGSDESDGTVWTVPSKTWYVSALGSDTNDGASWNSAKKTIAGALNVAQGTDEIWVAKGSYVETLQLPAGVAIYGGFAGSETARGQRNWLANPTVVDGNHNTLLGSHGRDVVVDGFTVRNGDDGFVLYSGSAAISNCTFSGNTMYTIEVVSGAGTISNCSIDGGGWGTAVKVNNGSVSIANCTLKNGNFAVIVYGGTTALTNCAIGENSEGIWSDGGTVAVTNCTIVHSGNAVEVTAGTAAVTNSIIAFNLTGFNAPGNSAWTLSHNDSFGNSEGNYYGTLTDATGTNGNISKDPVLFSAGGDYHLLAGSACIDAGDDTVLTAGETDLDGRPRKIGAHVDIGAYEFGTAYPTIAAVAKTLYIAGGVLPAAPDDLSGLNVEPGQAIDMLDAVRLARKSAGLDPNP